MYTSRAGITTTATNSGHIPARLRTLVSGKTILRSADIHLQFMGIAALSKCRSCPWVSAAYCPPLVRRRHTRKGYISYLDGHSVFKVRQAVTSPHRPAVFWWACAEWRRLFASNLRGISSPGRSSPRPGGKGYTAENFKIPAISLFSNCLAMVSSENT